MNQFGQLQLANFEGLGKMEQDVASAASAIETSDEGLTGAPHYNPVLFFCAGFQCLVGLFIRSVPPRRSFFIIQCQFTSCNPGLSSWHKDHL